MRRQRRQRSGRAGIGVKTAAELVNTFGDLETLLGRLDEIKQPKRRQALIDNADKARLSKVLVKLDYDAPLPCPLSALAALPYDPKKLFPFLDEMELRALKSRIAQRLRRPRRLPGRRSKGWSPSSRDPAFHRAKAIALLDTLEGLDHWIEAAQRPGSLPSGRRAAGLPGSPKGGPSWPGWRWRWRQGSPPMCRWHRAAAISTPRSSGSNRSSRTPGCCKIGHDAKGAGAPVRL